MHQYPCDIAKDTTYYTSLLFRLEGTGGLMVFRFRHCGLLSRFSAHPIPIISVSVPTQDI